MDKDKVEDVEVSKEEVKPEVKPKEVKERYAIIEVVTEKGLAIVDNQTEKVFTQDGLLVEILNKLDKLERALVWLE